MDEDRYFSDTAQCVEWFVADAIGAKADLYVTNGDLTTFTATTNEHNLWVGQFVTGQQSR